MSPISAFSLLASLLLALLAGVALLRYLVCPPRQMGRFLLLLVLSSAASIGLVLFTLQRTPLVLASLAANLVLFLLAYLGATRRFLRQQPAEKEPTIERAPGEAGAGHTAVLYYTHGEPPEYDPMPWLETMREFDADGAAFIPWPFRPFFFYHFREGYLKLGRSPHNEIHAQIVARLQSQMDQLSPGIRLHLAFLDSDPRPDTILADILNAGASRVIVQPVFITTSSHTQAGEEMIAALQPEAFGLETCFAKPLWQSEVLQRSFVNRALKALGDTDRSRAGVLLVGHGQPQAWDRLYPTQTEQEDRFRTAIRAHLMAAGFQPQHVALAWMEFKEPDIPSAAGELAARGIEKLLVFSTSISATSLHSAVDVPQALIKAKLPAEIEVIDLGAWGDPDDELVMQALREQILSCG